MHEVALSNQLARVVDRAAAGRRVLTVFVEIGALRQVIPDTLAYAWTFVTHNTTLEGAELSITWIPVTVRCPNLHTFHPKGEFSIDCPECGEIGVIVDGEQFRVTDIDVETTNP